MSVLAHTGNGRDKDDGLDRPKQYYRLRAGAIPFGAIEDNVANSTGRNYSVHLGVSPCRA